MLLLRTVLIVTYVSVEFHDITVWMTTTCKSLEILLYVVIVFERETTYVLVRSLYINNKPSCLEEVIQIDTVTLKQSPLLPKVSLLNLFNIYLMWLNLV